MTTDTTQQDARKFKILAAKPETAARLRVLKDAHRTTLYALLDAAVRHFEGLPVEEQSRLIREGVPQP